ncbi:MAG: phage tail tape measure protein [Christensenellaceae bacterium]
MAGKKNIIGIKFGVDSESVGLIKSQLEDIASKIQIDVHVNKTHFSSQLASLKKELDRTLGELKINIDTRTATRTTGKSSSGVSDADAQTEAYKRARVALLNYYKLKERMLSLNKSSAAYVEGEEKLREQSETYKEQLKLLKDIAGEDDKRILRLSEIKTKLEDAYNAQEQQSEAKPTMKGAALDKLLLRAQSLSTDKGYDKIIARSEEARNKVHALQEEINNTLYSGKKRKESITREEFNRLNESLIKTETDLKKIGEETDTVGNKIKEAFNKHVIQSIASWLLMLATRALKQVYDNVVKLDKAVTNLQIATGKTREETQALIQSYAALAKQLGATKLEVADAADTWLRQGYNIIETNKLITYTLMLSKLGQLESAEAAKALTSAMKGYKVSVEDAVTIVDKFTAVDMEAAINAGDIATAMAETAASAEIAGVSMDKLIGYIATVGEVTQDGAESVGTFYKTLFARMGNVKAGKFVDDETGESLNDVEKVLNNVGISLRDSDGEFREFGNVLDDVANKWDRYDNVQQHAIATAFAGTRQQEKFIVLMENYGDALNYASTAATSAGVAQQKYQEAYLDSIDAKLNELTASWQEFSTLLLDSDLIKGAVSFLTGIVDILNSILGIADGMLVTIPAITVSLVALYAILVKIKSTTVFITMWTHLKSILAVFPAIILGLKSIVLNILSEARAHSLSRKALISKAAATKAATAAQQAMNATNPVGWIILAVSAIMALGQALGKYANKTKAAKDASEKYKEAAEQAKEAAEESKEQTQELVDLVAEYKKVTDGIDDSATFSAETRQKVLEIQKKITDLVGEEAENYDLLNGKIEDNIKKNMALLAQEAGGAYEDAIDAYYAAMDSSNHAYETSYKDVGGFNFWGLWGLTDPESYYQIVFQAGEDAEKYAEGVYDIIAGMDERILISRDATIGDKFFGVNLDVDSAQEAVEVLDELLTKMREAGYRDGNIYAQFNELRERYNAYVLTQNNALSEVASSAAMSYGMQHYSEGLSIGSLADYKAYRDNIIESVAKDEEITKIGVDKSIIENEVDNWLSVFFEEWYNKLVDSTQDVILTKKPFIDILKEIEDEFDTLTKALEEIEKAGALSADVIEKLLNEYEGLQKYFTLTDQGYVVADAYKGWSTSEILEDFTTDYLQSYVDALAKCEEGTEAYSIAQENLNNAIAVCATLLRSQAIKDATAELEEHKDSLEEQLDKYKDLVDIRKDLLNTYKEELDYQKELAQKQKAVADLQARLAIARLDTSASGQAQVRALESELNSAKEDLDEYTLEQAINDITEKIDGSYTEYESFIKGEVDRLEQAIADIAKNINVTVNVPSPTPTNNDTHERWTSYQDAVDAGFSNIAGASASERGRVKNWDNPKTGKKYASYQEYLDVMYEKYIGKTPVYHTGGFVGDYSELKSNELFAKLLKGEFVATPEQMDNFIKEILPSMMITSGGGDSFEYNAPIFEIKCDSIDKETLPDLETILNKAVDRFNKYMKNALSRTGHKNNFNK